MDRVVVVTKPSRLDGLVLRHLTFGAARFVLESNGQSFEEYQKEDAVYKAALREVQQGIPNDIPVTVVSRDELPNFLFRDTDLIVVCGPDGLFANLAQYVGSQLVLSVNPDPATIAGVLMLFTPSDVRNMIARVRKGSYRSERLPLAKATIDKERIVWGVNDIFIGRRDHVSARYTISSGPKTRSERQSSSGIVVSTGIGSTGWMQSIAAMVQGLVPGGTPHALLRLPHASDNELMFVVREPFPSPTTGATIVTGRVLPGQPLTVHSEMPDGGCVFSDGMTEKAVSWTAGSSVVVSVGDRHIERIVP